MYTNWFDKSIPTSQCPHNCYQYNPISCCAVWMMGDKNGPSSTEHRTLESSLPVKLELLENKLREVTVSLLECTQPSLPWTNARNEACRWEVGTRPSIKTHTGLRYAGEAHPPGVLPLRPPTRPHTPAQFWKAPTEGFPGTSWKVASYSEVKVAQLWPPQSHLSLCEFAQLACPGDWSRSSFVFHFLISRHLENLTAIISVSNGLTGIGEGKPVSPSEFTKPTPRSTSIKEKLILIKEI